MKPNILLITLDQFRGDSMSCAGHPLVQTPYLDDLARNGLRLSKHYSQASPCAPGRASLYTGTYQMNHRVVANGTPLDERFDNIALAARRAGYNPTLFGYTDQSVDPRVTTGPDDERLATYEGVLPGFECALDLTRNFRPWREFLKSRGHDTAMGILDLLKTERDRPADVSVSSFLTNELLSWIGEQEGPWFAHASYIRPHPPYSAAGHFSSMYPPDNVGSPISLTENRHPFHDVMLQLEDTKAPEGHELAEMRSQYFGMISEVDAQLGRVWTALRESGQWDNTVIVVVADHAELLGDHGLKEKVGYWDTSQHVVGIVRDPRHQASHGDVVTRFTENVDIMPTLCDAMDIPIPSQCDGVPLTPFLQGVEPEWWRNAAHWEYDWRFALIPLGQFEWPWNRRLEQMNLSVRRSDTHLFVQFADGDSLCFDLIEDPYQRVPTDDPHVVLRETRALLKWRMEHADRTLTGFLVEAGGKGRWPANVHWRSAN
ncbi:MAG: sulfatase-like hydrolase/transferase [Ilumatobacteraceae bacterium]